MEKVAKLFMEALKASLENRKTSWEEGISEEEWDALFKLGRMHHVLPMIYESVYDCQAINVLAPAKKRQMHMEIINAVVTQTLRSNAFGELYDKMRKEGILPCVVKGIICRNLYPSPDYRISGDEDVFIPEVYFEKSHKLYIEEGLSLLKNYDDLNREYEVSYFKAETQIHIELHKHLFAPEAEALGDLNRFFDGVHERSTKPHKGECGLISENIEGVNYLTLNHTDHLLYLILHSFKHFLHSGFGLRQVCDIILYANAHGREVDWDYILACLREVRADLFARALFMIGEKYLTFDPVGSVMSDDFRSIDVDETAMLMDLLSAGVYGQADMSRRHSSNITMNAMIADRRGEKVKNGRIQNALKAVCLPVDHMVGRFPYLRKYPFLLPYAWLQRLLIYRKETAGNQGGNRASESLKIGNERVELMRKYGIIK